MIETSDSFNSITFGVICLNWLILNRSKTIAMVWLCLAVQLGSLNQFDVTQSNDDAARRWIAPLIGYWLS